MPSKPKKKKQQRRAGKFNAASSPVIDNSHARAHFGREEARRRIETAGPFEVIRPKDSYR
jgi:hypothetical protein